MALLARREHGARELVRKLEARGVEPDAAVEAVAELGREGWQSDARYAGMLVRTRTEAGYGPLRIEAELRQAGLPGEAIAAALADAGVDWCEQCALAHARKFGALPQSQAERAKQYRFLQARGFDGGHITTVLRGGSDD